MTKSTSEAVNNVSNNRGGKCRMQPYWYRNHACFSHTFLIAERKRPLIGLLPDEFSQKQVKLNAGLRVCVRRLTETKLLR